MQPINNQELKVNARRAYDEARLRAQQDLLDASFAAIIET
jgi:hypothetical protein